MQARLEKLGGQSIYDHDQMLKELKLQNDVFIEKDETKQQALLERVTTRLVGATSLTVAAGLVDGYLRLLHTFQKYQGVICTPNRSLMGR